MQLLFPTLRIRATALVAVRGKVSPKATVLVFDGYRLIVQPGNKILPPLLRLPHET